MEKTLLGVNYSLKWGWGGGGLVCDWGTDFNAIKIHVNSSVFAIRNKCFARIRNSSSHKNTPHHWLTDVVSILKITQENRQNVQQILITNIILLIMMLIIMTSIAVYAFISFAWVFFPLQMNNKKD